MHSLKIAIGRYAKNRIDQHLRICPVCVQGTVEDEYHFVLICTAFSGSIEYIDPFFTNFSSLHKFTPKFTLLMKCKDEQTIKDLGKFIYESFLLRSTLL